ncbi:hypothetical protein [Sphingobacterium siyangense]|uniref:hypothetical protein n=1 Tax=Sphingobacterium siyangense TaxID=459529 RepID=UPI002FDD7946
MYSTCDATGKKTLPSIDEARYLIYIFSLMIFDRMTGKRIKHRRGRPTQKRAYQCHYCGGFHLTKWPIERFKNAPQHICEVSGSESQNYG